MNMAELRLAARQRFLALLPAGSLRRRFISASAWSLLGGGCAQFLGFLAAVGVARLLGSHGFGAFGFVQSTAAMLTLFAHGGFASVATKYVAELRVTEPGRAGRVMALSFLATAVSGCAIALPMLVWAEPLAAWIMQDPALAGSMRWCALLTWLSALSGVQAGCLAGFEAFRTLALANSLRAAVTLVLSLLGAGRWGLQGALAGLVTGVVLQLVHQELALRRLRSAFFAGLSARGALGEWRLFPGYALPALLGGVLVMPVMWLGNEMLLVHGGYAELGVFNAANQWRNALLLLQSLLASVSVPMLSALLAAGDRSDVRRLIGGTFAASLASSLPVVALLVAFAQPIMGLYGPGFGGRGLVLSAVAVAAGLFALQTPISHVLVAAGRMWTGFVMNAAWAAVFLGCAWWLLRQGMGADGLAVAYGIAYAAHAGWTFVYGWRHWRGKAGARGLGN